jgi:excisionase family DNA binding protein
MTQWLSVEDIAKELNVPLDTVRAWIRSKRLKAYKPGKEYRVKREDLDRFLEESANIDDNSKNKE